MGKCLNICQKSVCSLQGIQKDVGKKWPLLSNCRNLHKIFTSIYTGIIIIVMYRVAEQFGLMDKKASFCQSFQFLLASLCTKLETAEFWEQTAREKIFYVWQLKL